MRAQARISYMTQVDIVIPYVNCWDTNWLSQAFKYCNYVEYQRVRDLGTLRYVFRGIDKNMSWIHNTILVVQSPTQIPAWLNISHPKLRIVYHYDYIPKKYLPTFNSNTIELYYYKIPGLTNKFILANDDTVAIRKLLPTDFFIDNSIVYGNTIYHNEWVPDREIGSKCYVETLYHTALAAGKITGKNNRPMYEGYHLFMPHLKWIYKMCWSKYGSGIRGSFKYHRQRWHTNLTHMLFYYIAEELGKVIHDDTYRPGLINVMDGMHPDSIIDALETTGSKMCCMNDLFNFTPDSIASNTVCAPLDHFLPEKSSYEL